MCRRHVRVRDLRFEAVSAILGLTNLSALILGSGRAMPSLPTPRERRAYGATWLSGSLERVERKLRAAAAEMDDLVEAGFDLPPDDFTFRIVRHSAAS